MGDTFRIKKINIQIFEDTIVCVYFVFSETAFLISTITFNNILNSYKINPTSTFTLLQNGGSSTSKSEMPKNVNLSVFWKLFKMINLKPITNNKYKLY